MTRKEKISHQFLSNTLMGIIIRTTNKMIKIKIKIGKSQREILWALNMRSSDTLML
jgi:hypothetical protein